MPLPLFPPADPTELAAQALDAVNQGALEQALELLGRLQHGSAEPALTLHLAGLVSLRANEIGKAVNAFEAAHRLKPTINEPVEMLAILYAKLGRLTDALYYGKLSVAAQDRFPVTGLVPEWLGTFEQSFFAMQDRPLLAQAEQAMATGNYGDAIRCYRQASEIDAGSVETWRGLALACRLAGQPFDALTALRRIESIMPPAPADYSALGQSLELLGRWDDAQACHDHAVSLAPADEQIGWAALRHRINQPAGPAEIAAQAAIWARNFAPIPMFERAPVPDYRTLAQRPLRLGVYTANWLDAAGLELVVPLLLALPRDKIDLRVYSDGYADTPLARTLRGHAAGWESLTDLDDETAAFTLGNEELDAVIDLDGPLRRRPRPLLFRYLAHPHAYAFLETAELAEAAGFAGTLADSVAGLSLDKIIGIPGIAASLPRDLSLLVDPVPLRAHGPVVFGTLARLGRISLTATALWADLLTRMPGSMLAFDPERLAGENGIGEILSRFERLGLRERVRTDQTENYLAEVDLLLDPPGCPDYEAPIAALAAGVPVITCPGTLPAAAVLGNWIEMLGLPELVARDGESYLDRACATVAPETSPALVEKLRSAITRESAFGTAHRAKLLEATLREKVSRR